jgi:hypothetical protein
VTLASNQMQPVRLVLDGDYVYWVNLGTGNPGTASDGSVMRVNKDGTGLLAIAQSQSSPLSLFVVGANVFWNNAGTGALTDGSIVRAPTSGGAITTLYSPIVGSATGPKMVTDGTNVFWQGGSSNIYRGSLTAVQNQPPPTVLFTGQPTSSGGFARDDARLFWAAFASNAPIFIGPSDGGTDASIIAVGSEANPVALTVDLDAGALFWANYSGNAIREMSLSTLEAGTFTGNLQTPSAIATDDTYVYWWANQQIQRMNKDGTGAPEVVATYGNPGIGDIAVDDTAVFLAQRGSGVIVKIAKP